MLFQTFFCSNLFFYYLIVGPVEELFFRVYLQKTFVNIFSKNKWIGVIIASALFGFWHLINGSIIQVLFTFGIGLVFGLTKEYIKDLNKEITNVRKNMPEKLKIQ